MALFEDETLPFEEQKFPPAALYAVTGFNPVTVRSWKQRGVTAPLDIHVTGQRSLYSFLEITLFAFVKVLIERGFEPREAMKVGGVVAAQAQAMLMRKSGVWERWILLTSAKPSATQTIWAVSSKEQLVEYFEKIDEYAQVLDLGRIARRTKRLLSEGGWK